MTNWHPVVEGEHPLGRLSRVEIGGFRTQVLLGQENRVGARYFQILLMPPGGQAPEAPAIAGLHHAGRYPAHNWVEVMSTRLPSQEGVTEAHLFRLLASIIPPGGHLMVEYDGEDREETGLALGRGVPPVLTPLGSALFFSGCDGGFKDWYISEGGNEGPRKLQAYKALDVGMRQRKAGEMAREVALFLQATSTKVEGPLGSCRERAPQVLSELRGDIQDPELRDEIDLVLASRSSQ